MTEHACLATPPAAPLADEFRQAMRRLAGGVCVITGLAGEARLGITATAVCSLSADPPSILACVNRRSSLCTALAPGQPFCINVLSSHQTEIASTFGSNKAQLERFAGGSWDAFDDGIPFLTDAQCSIRCQVDGAMDYGSHTIYIGKALSIRVAERFQPLIYGDGTYHHLRPLG